MLLPFSSASNAINIIEKSGLKQEAVAKTLATSSKEATPDPLSLRPELRPNVSQWAPITKIWSFEVL